MKYFAVVTFLTATAVSAIFVEDDCCEVPTGTSCPADYPVALTTTAEVREALSLSGVACCASDAQASEFGKDPLVACPVQTTSDGDEGATVTTMAAGGPVTTTDTCCSTADKTCPDDKVLLEDVDTNVEGTQVHACCVSDGDFNLSDMSLEPCVAPATADVQITSAGGDEATTTTTSSGGEAASDCCLTSGDASSCPSGKTFIDDVDTMINGVNHHACCEGGNFEMELMDLDVCSGTASTESDGGTSAAPKERAAIAIGMILVGAALQ